MYAYKVFFVDDLENFSYFCTLVYGFAVCDCGAGMWWLITSTVEDCRRRLKYVELCGKVCVWGAKMRRFTCYFGFTLFHVDSGTEELNLVCHMRNCSSQKSKFFWEVFSRLNENGLSILLLVRWDHFQNLSLAVKFQKYFYTKSYSYVICTVSLTLEYTVWKN